METITDEKTINYSYEKQRLVITEKGRKSTFLGRLALLMLKYEQKKDENIKIQIRK